MLNGFSKQDHLTITTLGLEFAAAEILGCGVGWWMDNKWATTPWLLITGAVVGFGLGLYIVLRRVYEMEQQEKQTKK